MKKTEGVGGANALDRSGAMSPGTNLRDSASTGGLVRGYSEMKGDVTQLVHVEVAGQDDNLGDSVLRRGYLHALRGPNRRFRLLGRAQTSDYLAGLALADADEWFASRDQWLESPGVASAPVQAFNAGEINPTGLTYPTDRRARELAAARNAGGVVVVAGIGLKDAEQARRVSYLAPFRDADVVSWRDSGSQAAAGFGEANPDWAFALGSSTSSWEPTAARKLIAVTLRFDRPYPDAAWMAAVLRLAKQTSARIVTVAQVARDAPRAVRLAADLGAVYLGAPSFAHDVLEAHVRGLYQRSLAVISDRAHGLIIGATEGAYPIGSGADSHKISRLLDEVGLGSLVGAYDALPDFVEQFADGLDDLAPAIDAARDRLTRLTRRIQTVLGAIAPYEMHDLQSPFMASETTTTFANIGVRHGE